MLTAGRADFRRGEPLKVLMAPGLVLPKALFKFQLQQAVFEGTCNTGVRWWFDKVAFPVGAERQSSVDMSVRFICRHARLSYRKKATDDSRKSKHTSCVNCQASVRFHGSKVTDDPSVAVVVTAQLNHRVNDPLTQLRIFSCDKN